jgi:hypothetical protein
MQQDQDSTLDWETVQMQFLQEWQEGKAPALQNYVQRYPQWADELTDFVMHWLPMHNAAHAVEEVATASAETTAIIAQVMQQTATPVRTLAEARRQLGWSPGRLARELNLPERMGVQLMRGLRDWPPQLEEKLAALLGRSQAQVRALLQATTPQPATQWKAKGQPSSKTAPLPRWQEALEECARRGELTAEQCREWQA